MKTQLTYLLHSLRDKAMQNWTAYPEHKDFMFLYSMACDACEEWAYLKGLLESKRIDIKED